MKPCLWIGCLWVSLSVWAQTPGDFPDQFKAFAEEQLAQWNAISVAVSIVKDGKVILAEGYGQRDPEAGLAANGNTLYAIGSCSKAMTATAVGILVDQKKLTWDSKAADLIPGFQLRDPTATALLTPVDMLSHRSGLPRHDSAWYGTNFTRRELIQNLRFLEPSAELREVFQYNNLMYMAAGVLVEEVSGQSWEAFTQEHILNPLGMKRANFSVTAMQKDDNHALPYEQRQGKNERVDFRSIDAVGPAGAINASAREMANWMLLNLGEGEFADQRLIEAGTLQKIHMAHTAIPQPTIDPELGPASYCLGWSVSSYRGHLTLGHSGGIDGFRALVWLLPHQELGITVLTNLGGTPITNIMAYRAADLLTGLEPMDWAAKRKQEIEERRTAQEAEEEDKPVPGTKPTHALADYQGTYNHAGYGSVEIGVQGEQLHMTFHTFKIPLKHWHFDTFSATETVYEDTKLNFQTGEDGSIASLSITLEGAVDPIVFKRQP